MPPKKPSTSTPALSPAAQLLLDIGKSMGKEKEAMMSQFISILDENWVDTIKLLTEVGQKQLQDWKFPFVLAKKVSEAAQVAYKAELEAASSSGNSNTSAAKPPSVSMKRKPSNGTSSKAAEEAKRAQPQVKMLLDDIARLLAKQLDSDVERLPL